MRAMTPREIAFRSAYRLRLATERITLAAGRGPASWSLRDVLRPAFASRADRADSLLQHRRNTSDRFFASVADRDRTRRLLTSQYRHECEAARAHAAAAAEHAFAFFGRRFSYGAEIDWNADPVTGAAWPRTYHTDVHSGNTGSGDVKDVWELNRHQFLIDLGKSYFVDRTPEHAAEVRLIVQHWRRENPYGIGVNWACALEPAFRVFSWLWAYYLCLDDPAFTGPEHEDWLKGFHEHGVFLSRHLEYYSSPYNHLIGEASALYALGVLFPEFRDAPTWHRRGHRVLEDWIDVEFHRDGMSVEQSTFYHHATLGFYLLAILIGRRNGGTFSTKVLDRVERAIAASMYMALPDGRTPSIGGADDGKPIRLEHLPFWDFRPYQAIGAVLFGRPDFKYAAERFHEDALWLLGSEGLSRFDELPSSRPADTSCALDASGYFILRTDWSPDADYACFDCGDQAGGLRTDDVPSAAHGHADCLSVIAVLAGAPVLVDPGFYTYNGPQAWEAHFRKTRAHNTASIDGRDQARHIAKMRWCRAARARLEHWQADERQSRVTGSHDGFARSTDGVTHRRTVWLRPGGYLVIYDEFIGSGTHDVVLNYQFAPGIATLLDGNGIALAAGFELRWSGHDARHPSLACGDESDPDGGWIAASLGVRVPAPRLKLPFRIEGDAAVLTILTDIGTASRPWRSRVVVQTRRADGQLEAAVVGPDYVDWVLAPGGAGPTGMFTTDGKLAIWRVTTDSVFSEQVRLGGTFMQAACDAPGWLTSLRDGPRPGAPRRRVTREEQA
jgi:hypothetical protein